MKSRDMILAGTTTDKMRGVYSRPHRNSIYEQATIHDLTFEVLKELFKLLSKSWGSDLAPLSFTCRAFRAVALELMHTRKRFIYERIEPYICGLHLRCLVGLEMCTIKHFVLDVNHVGKEYIQSIAQVAASTLVTLSIASKGIDSSECYGALNAFYEKCDGIRNLRLVDFDFGDDPMILLPIAKHELSRLMQFDAIECRGDLRMFVEHTPIPNLKLLRNQSSDLEDANDEDILSALASKYQSLVDVHIIAQFESSASLLKAVRCCRGLRSLVIEDDGGGLMFEQSDILAIVSLPRLESLKIYRCGMSDDAYSALVRLR
jgi:hypothetical protein